jgi:hypothetical protein
MWQLSDSSTICYFDLSVANYISVLANSSVCVGLIPKLLPDIIFPARQAKNWQVSGCRRHASSTMRRDSITAGCDANNGVVTFRERLGLLQNKATVDLGFTSTSITNMIIPQT